MLNYPDPTDISRKIGALIPVSLAYGLVFVLLLCLAPIGNATTIFTDAAARSQFENNTPSGVDDLNKSFATIRTQATGNWLKRTSGGSLNGTSIDASHNSITVSPGASITGSIRVTVNNTDWGSGSVITLGGTVNWGNRTTQRWASGSAGQGQNTYSVSVSKT